MRLRIFPMLGGLTFGAALGVALSLLAGPAVPLVHGEGGEPPPAPAPENPVRPLEQGGAPSNVRLRIGDTLSVAVFNHPELSAAVMIQPDGTLTFHFVGRIAAAGETVDTVTSRIAAALERVHSLREPIVSVALTDVADRTVYILGRVRSSGSHDLPESRPLTLLQLVAMAGGFEDDADRGRVYLHRGIGATRTVRAVDLTGVERDGSAANDISVDDGDTVYVPRSEEVSVLGEVNSPGSFTTRSGKPWTALAAIAQAKGFTRYADKGEILWIREGNRGNRVDRLNADRILRGQDPDPQVAPGDLLFVTERAW
jgi:polysaccharide export outer membrane protein